MQTIQAKKIASRWLSNTCSPTVKHSNNLQPIKHLKLKKKIKNAPASSPSHNLDNTNYKHFLYYIQYFVCCDTFLCNDIRYIYWWKKTIIILIVSERHEHLIQFFYKKLNNKIILPFLKSEKNLTTFLKTRYLFI